eukprot:772620-Prorocentrum_minimum.AAC.1
MAPAGQQDAGAAAQVAGGSPFAPLLPLPLRQGHHQGFLHRAYSIPPRPPLDPPSPRQTRILPRLFVLHIVHAPARLPTIHPSIASYRPTMHPSV